MSLDGTQAGLIASVGALLNRGDLASLIPDWIMMAEAQLTRRFVQAGGVRPMIIRSDASLSAEFSALPTDYKGIRSIYLTEDRTRPLTKATPAQINRLKNITLTLTGKPQCFAIVGTSIQLFRAPDVAYPAEITYLQAIPPLASNSGNWLISAHPDAYLYWTALQSPLYLKADTRLEMWGTVANQIADDIIAANVIEEDAPELETYQEPGYTP